MELKPEHPHDAGLTEKIPDSAHLEGAEDLANEARRYLRRLGFTDLEINEWAFTYIVERHSGSVDSFLTWIAEKERTGRPPSS